MIEFRQLQYFLSVANHEHFGKASEELNIVQPALSRQIKQLEDELGLLLFERVSRGVKLTPAGKMLQTKASALLKELDRSILSVHNAAKGITGSLRLGFADGATYSGHMPQVIKKFREKHPHVDLELIPASSQLQAEMLAEETLDAGFMYWLPRGIPSIDHQSLNVERVVVAASTNHLLAKRSSISLADLDGVPVVWIKREKAPMFYDMVLTECTKSGITLNVVQEAFTESAMLSLASAGVGVTFITEAAAGRKPHNVKLLQIKNFKPKLDLQTVWRNDNPNPALRSFIALVRSGS